MKGKLSVGLLIGTSAVFITVKVPRFDSKTKPLIISPSDLNITLVISSFGLKKSLV